MTPHWEKCTLALHSGLSFVFLQLCDCGDDKGEKTLINREDMLSSPFQGTLAIVPLFYKLKSGGLKGSLGRAEREG